MTETKPILFLLKDGATRPEAQGLRERFSPLAREIARGTAFGPMTATLATLAAFADAADDIDLAYGEDSEVPIADVAGATDGALQSVATLAASLESSDLTEAAVALDALTVGIAVWAMRHKLQLTFPEPVVNALARKANHASTAQDNMATYAITQGFIAHMSPLLEGDLERSNPERPWRILNLNFAITAIRTGDLALMKFAFAQLNQALPDESASFYSAAFSIACQPGFAVAARDLISAELNRASRLH